MTVSCAQALGPDHSLDVTCVWDNTGDTKVEASKMEEGGHVRERSPSPAEDAPPEKERRGGGPRCVCLYTYLCICVCVS